MREWTRKTLSTPRRAPSLPVSNALPARRRHAAAVQPQQLHLYRLPPHRLLGRSLHHTPYGGVINKPTRKWYVLHTSSNHFIIVFQSNLTVLDLPCRFVSKLRRLLSRDDLKYRRRSEATTWGWTSARLSLHYSTYDHLYFDSSLSASSSRLNTCMSGLHFSFVGGYDDFQRRLARRLVVILFLVENYFMYILRTILNKTYYYLLLNCSTSKPTVQSTGTTSIYAK